MHKYEDGKSYHLLEVSVSLFNQRKISGYKELADVNTRVK
ncbi:hypothetical protein J2S05_003115 [Alkalicoccobacillus murimartini]|uniref:Transposase n=1 Tax=Alkalicoccobacillus murimartini TaxID=171685 RepID=A0ABT9YMS3_9BACI|nr:hypothetical protein [Alkalicoccobacillus murimartini]